MHAPALGALAALLLGAAASSDPPEDPPPAPEPPELTPEERRALAESLAADRAAAATEPHALPPVPIAGGLDLDLALVLDAAAAVFSDREPSQLGAHDPAASGFALQQLELQLASTVDPYFRVDAIVVFTPFSVEVEEAYGTTMALPWSLQARAGQFLSRFGRINAQHPHAWQFVDQPLVIGKFFGPESNRLVGLELSWLSPLPWYLEVVGTTASSHGDCCARTFDAELRGPGDLIHLAGVEQFFPLGSDWSLLWGVSAMFGPAGTGFGNRAAIYATDLYLRWRPVASVDRTAVSLQTEVMYRSREVPGDRLAEPGGYAQLVWSIDPRWETGVRTEWVGGVEDDPLDPRWSEARTRHAAQLTFFPSHFSRLRLQGSLDEVPWREDPVLGAMLQLELSAGEHGAHPF